jgi:hypothetical protein
MYISLITAALQAVGVFAVHLAAHKSLLSQAAGALATKTLQTELIHNLSGSKHVSGMRHAAD